MNKQNVLSVTVSKEVYLTVNRLATGMGISVSKFITNKLFRNEGELDSTVVRTPSAELVETQADAENKRLNTLVFELQEKLTNAEDKSLRYFNEIERLTSKANTLQEKLMASQEQTTYYKIENESLKPRNSTLQVLLDAEKQISAEQAQEIRSYKDYKYRIEDNLETAKNENIRQKEENQKLNEEIQALKGKAQQVDSLNDQIKELQTQVISAQQEAYTSAAFYSGALKLYSKEEKKIQAMRGKHNIVIREIIHKLSHEPELFKNRGQFKFLENEIWE